MKVLLINGSPHAKGSTYTALHEMEKVFTENGIEAEIIHIGKSSRRKFLLMRNFRPLTPPCVPFGTRRFNQLNM